MKMMILAAALMGATILGANAFATANNGTPTAPTTSRPAILRLANESDDCYAEAHDACKDRCKGNTPTEDCKQCVRNIYNACYSGGGQ